MNVHFNDFVEVDGKLLYLDEQFADMQINEESSAPLKMSLDKDEDKNASTPLNQVSCDQFEDQTVQENRRIQTYHPDCHTPISSGLNPFIIWVVINQTQVKMNKKVWNWT